RVRSKPVIGGVCLAVVVAMGWATPASGSPDRVGAATWGRNVQYGLDGQPFDRPTPSPVVGLPQTVNQVASGVGADHALALLADGTVWAWGNNHDGELGDGTTSDRFTPAAVPGLTNVRQVAAGGGYSLALRSDGTVWSWGHNQEGQLGDGSF